MRINIDEDTREIERGDIVRFNDKICLITEAVFTSKIYLINLSCCLVAEEFRDIEQVRECGLVSLVAKGSDIELINKKED